MWWNQVAAAHNRELAAKDDERLTVVAIYENVIAAKDREIARLRECLKEAVREKCPFTRMSCKHSEPCDYECGTEKWRNALKEATVKPSEMTNEELAKALMRRVPLDSNNHDDIREAAARLRKIDTYCAVNEQQDIDNAKLRANLKVAEDALEKIDNMCDGDMCKFFDHTHHCSACRYLNGCQTGVAHAALAEIREKGANNGK